MTKTITLHHPNKKSNSSDYTSVLKFISAIILLFFFTEKSSSQNITIVESQSANSGHVMDDVWRDAALNMGFNAAIVPQSTLYDTTFFQNTDALIVSSGAIILTNDQINTINFFMKSGKNLYLQAEYDCAAYNTNSTFEAMVNNNGGVFNWNGIIAGTLAPMDVVGTLGTTPNSVAPLNYFWYGCRGNACSYVDANMTFNGDNFGFVFCPPDATYGKVICNSDQDWVRTNVSPPLIQNILTLLAGGAYNCAGPLSFQGAFIGNDTVICDDDQIILTSGTQGTGYVWSTGSVDSSIVVDTAGSYWVTVTNGLCMSTDTIEISEVPCNTPSFGASTTEVCEKFCVDFYDSTSTGATAWLWLFPGGAPSSSTTQNPVNICYQTPGVYDVTLITNNTSGSDTITLPDYITVNATPPVPVITQTGNTLTSSVADFYQWQLNNMEIPGATSQSYDVQQSGYYAVIVSDTNGCVASASIEMLLEGIDEMLPGVDLQIFPNPVSDMLTITIEGLTVNDDLEFAMHNLLGQIVFSSMKKNQDSSFSVTIPTKSIPSGIYFLRATIGNSQQLMKTKTIIVQ